MSLEAGIDRQFRHIRPRAIGAAGVADEEAVENVAELGGLESVGGPFLDAESVVAEIKFGMRAEMSLKAHAQGPEDGKELVEIVIDVEFGQAEGEEQRMLAEEELEGLGGIFQEREVHADAIRTAATTERRRCGVGEEVGDFGAGVAADGVADGGEPGLNVGGIEIGEGDAGKIGEDASVAAGEAESAQVECKLPADSG